MRKITSVYTSQLQNYRFKPNRIQTIIYTLAFCLVVGVMFGAWLGGGLVR